jgi:ribosomal protein S3AE
MANVISYHPTMEKQKLEKLIKNKLHYKNLNQFIDHAVKKTLSEEMDTHPLAKKIAHEVEKAVYKYMPLKFVKVVKAKEAKSIEEAVKQSDKKGNWVSAEALMKKHSIQ